MSSKVAPISAAVSSGPPPAVMFGQSLSPYASGSLMKPARTVIPRRAASRQRTRQVTVSPLPPAPVTIMCGLSPATRKTAGLPSAELAKTSGSPGPPAAGGWWGMMWRSCRAAAVVMVTTTSDSVVLRSGLAMVIGEADVLAGLDPDGVGRAAVGRVVDDQVIAVFAFEQHGGGRGPA